MTTFDTIRCRLETIFSMPVLFREKEAVIAPVEMWVVLWGPYMYCHENIVGLIWQMTRYFADSSNFVG